MNIYVDGSYNMGAKGKPQAGVGIYFEGDVFQRMNITLRQSDKKHWLDNHAAELVGIYTALYLTRSVNDVIIHTDSQHCLLHLDQYRQFTRNDTWMAAKRNNDVYFTLFRECANIMEERMYSGYDTLVTKVKAHSGVYGNEIADDLARHGMMGVARAKAMYAVVECSSTTVCNTVAMCTEVKILRGNIKTKQSSTMPKKSWALMNSVPPPAPTPPAQGNLFSFATDSLTTNNAPLASASTEEREDIVPEIEENSDTVSEHNIPSDAETNSEEETTDRWLAYTCVQCNNIILFRYPYKECTKGVKTLLKGIGVNSYASNGITTCTNCLRDDAKTDKVSIEALATERAQNINKSKISVDMLDHSSAEVCLSKLYEDKWEKISYDNFLRYTSITDIKRIHDDNFKVCSVDVDNEIVLQYLKLGFL